MFSGDETAEEKVILIANWLSNHQQFKSHNRHISREELKTKGFLINYLENNQDLQDKVLSVYHSMTHTFGGTAATKLVENHLGKAFVKLDNSVKSPTNPIPPL